MPLRELSAVSVALFRRAGLPVPATDSARRMYGDAGLLQHAVSLALCRRAGLPFPLRTVRGDCGTVL